MSYSLTITTTFLHILATETILEESVIPVDYQSRTKSLDRRDMKKVKEKKSKDKDYVIEQVSK